MRNTIGNKSSKEKRVREDLGLSYVFAVRPVKGGSEQ